MQDYKHNAFSFCGLCLRGIDCVSSSGVMLVFFGPLNFVNLLARAGEKSVCLYILVSLTIVFPSL